MKKNLVIVISTIAVVLMAMSVFFSCHRKPSLAEAKRLEMTGDMERAYSLYAAILYESTPFITAFDNYRSKILAPEALKKEVGKYFIWLSGNAVKNVEEINTAMEGVERCRNNERRTITISQPEIRPLSADEYLIEWNKTFFAPEARIDPSHAAMASGNYARKFSLIVLKSQKSYTYEINLINKGSRRGTRCILLPENTVRLYALPGEHLLVCRSTVTFPSEKIWRSDFTAIPLAIPLQPSLITTELKTSVYRRKDSK